MSPLMGRIKDHVATQSGNTANTGAKVKLPPPTTASQLARAEAAIGFELPPLLRELYREIADGGFGPGEGFLGVARRRTATCQDLVKTYQGFVRRRGLEWPAHLLPVIYCGCDVYFCIDCDDPKNRVILFDGDLGGLDESDISEPRSEWPYPDQPQPACFRTRAGSFAEFLEMWLADETQLYRW